MLTSTTEEQHSPTSRSASPAKKPSYLNLACCVNGYSNLTTYDSKLRQNINKSREVSPIRPIIHTLQYNRGEANSPYLAVPVPMPIVNDNYTGNNGHLTMDTNKTTTKMLSSPDKRYFSTTTTTTASSSSSMRHSVAIDKDVTDNMGYIRSPAAAAAAAVSRHGDPESPKSFIQQRVERLYGPSALAAGFYSPKRSLNDSANSVLSERSQNSSNTSIHRFKTEFRSVATASPPNGTTTESENHVNQYQMNVGPEKAGEQSSLPVLRHLRPEFRAQLPIVSPKRTVAKTDFATNGGGHHNSNNKPVTTIIPIEVELPAAAVNGQHYSTAKHNKHSSDDTTSSQTPSTNHHSHNNHHQLPTNRQQQSTNNNASLLSSNGTSKASNGVSGGSLQEDSSVNTRVQRMQIKDEPMIIVGPKVAVSNGNGHLNGGGALSAQPDATSANVGAIDPQSTVSLAMPTAGATNGVKNGLYFLEVLNTERDRLLALAVVAEQYMDNLASVSILKQHRAHSNTPFLAQVMGGIRKGRGQGRTFVAVIYLLFSFQSIIFYLRLRLPLAKLIYRCGEFIWGASQCQVHINRSPLRARPPSTSLPWCIVVVF